MKSAPKMHRNLISNSQFLQKSIKTYFSIAWYQESIKKVQTRKYNIIILTQMPKHTPKKLQARCQGLSDFSIQSSP